MFVTLTSDTHYGWGGKSHTHHLKMLAKVKIEMDRLGCKVLVHAGDWAVWRQRQFRRALETFREVLGPDIIIIFVMGNHDHWYDPDEKHCGSWDEILSNHQVWFKELDVHWLENGMKVVGDVAFIGYNGWYADPKPNTNDRIYMLPGIGEGFDGKDAFEHFQRKSYRELMRCLDYDVTPYRKVVGVTHMPLMEGEYNGNPSWLQPFAEKCDVIFFGHSHKRVEGLQVTPKTKIYNSGSDYGKIRFLHVEV